MAPEAPEGGKKEAKEVLRDNYALASNTRLLRLSVGNLPTVASTNMTEADMETEASTLLRRTEFTNLSEVHRRGQMRATGNMVQHQGSSEQLLRLKEAQGGKWQPGQEEQYKHHLSELIISSQAATLKRYMPEMAMELAQFMEMALQDLPSIAINLPGDKQKELYDMELVARQFLSQLRLIIRERVSYENVNAIQTQRAKIERDVWRLRFLMESAKQNDEYVKDNRATFDASHNVLSSATAGEENILLLRLRPTLEPLGNKEAMAALDAYSKRGATVAEKLAAVTALEKALGPTYANFDARREIYMKTLSPESKDALEIGKMRMVIKNRQDVVDRQEFALSGFMAIEPVMAKELEEREAKLWPVIRALKEEYMKPAKDQDRAKINTLFADREKLMGSLRYSYGTIRTMLQTTQSELDDDDKRKGLEKMDREERDALESRRDILAYRLQMPLLVSQQVELDVTYKNTLPEIQKREDVYLTKRVESVRGKLAAITVDLDAEFQNQVGINTAEKKPALVIPAYYGTVKEIDKSVTRLFEVGKDAVDTDELKKQLDKSKAGREECIKTMEEAVKANKSEGQVRSLRAQITILKNRGDAEEDLLQYARLRKDPELRKGNADEPPFLAEHDAEKNLDQKMVWLMAGRGIESQGGGKPVLPPNFWPQYMLTTALQYRYEQYLALETQLARVDSPLSKEQKEEMLRTLNRARTAHMNKMLFVTAHLGDYQMRMAELIGIMEAQRGYTTEGSLDGTVRATPKKVKELLERGTQENFVFHVDRISAMAETAQNVFGEMAWDDKVKMDLVKNVEKFGAWVEQGLQKVAGMLSMADPNMGAKAKDFLKTNFPLSFNTLLDEASEAILIGTAPDKQAEKEEAIKAFKEQYGRDPKLNQPKGKTDDERKKDNPDWFVLKQIIVFNKMKSVQEEYTKFKDAGHAKNVVATSKALKELPPVSKFAGGRADPAMVTGVSRDKRVALADVTAFMNTVKDKAELTQEEKDLGATYYSMLIMQLRADWGSLDEGGFMQSYGKFLGAVENIVDNRLELIVAARAAERYFDTLCRNMLIAAGAVGVGGFLVGAGLAGGFVKAGGMLLRAPGQVWRHSITKGNRMGSATGALMVAHGAYRGWEDLKELGRLKDAFNAQKAIVVAKLLANGWEPDDAKNPTKFTLKRNGNKIAEIKMADFDQAMALKENQKYRDLGKDAAEIGAGIAIWAGAKFLGRWAGPIGIAIVIGIEIWKEEDEKATNIEVADKLPLEVLCHMSMEAFVKISEHELTTKLNGDQYAPLRKKLTLTHIYKEAEHFPQYYLKMFGGRPVEEFEKEHYDLFWKLSALRLQKIYANRKDEVPSWEQLKKGELRREAFLPRNDKPVGYFEMKRGIREGMILFDEHQKELQYRIALQGLEDDDGKDAFRKSELEAIVEALGEEEVLGGPLKLLKDKKDVLYRGGAKVSLKTRIEDFAEKYADDDSKAKGSHTITGKEVPGFETMPGGKLDLDNEDAVYGLVKDPATRRDLMYARYYEQKFEGIGLGDAFLISFGLKEKPKFYDDKAFRNHQQYMVPLAQKAEKGALDAEVAKKLREAIGALVQKWRDDNKDVKQLPPELIGLDIQSLEETDGMNLQALLTQASAAVHSYERVKTRPIGFRRFGKLEKRLPGGGPPPFLFCREDNAMHLPLLDAVGSEYKYENLLAVFGETTTLPDGRKVTLTTCVFGMNRSVNNLTIYQCVNFDGDRKLGVPVISNPAVFQGTQKGGQEMLDLMKLALATDPKARERFASARNAPPGAENAPKLADEDGPPIDGKEKPAEGGADGAVGKKTVTETTVKKIPGENPRDPVLLGKEEKITEESAKEKKVTTRTPKRTKNGKIIYSEKVEVTKPDGTVEREYKEFQRTVAEGPNKGKWWFIVKTTIQKPGKAEETVKSANVFEDPEKGEDKAIDPESEDGKLLNAKVKTTTVVKDIGGGKTGVEKRTVIEKAGVRTVTVEKPKLLAGEIVYDTTTVERKGDTQTVTEVTKLTADGKVTREKTTVTKGDQVISQTKKMEDGSIHEKTLLPKESKEAKKDVYSETIKFQAGEQVVTVNIMPTVDKSGVVKAEPVVTSEKGRLLGSPLAPPAEEAVKEAAPKVSPPVEGKEKASLKTKDKVDEFGGNLKKLFDIIQDRLKEKDPNKKLDIDGRFLGKTGENQFQYSIHTEGDTTSLILRRDPTTVRSSLQTKMFTDKKFASSVLGVKEEDITGYAIPFVQNLVSLDELQYDRATAKNKVAASTFRTNIFAYYTWKPGQEPKLADGEKDKYEWFQPLEQRNLRNIADLKALKAASPAEYRRARYALTSVYNGGHQQTLLDMINLCDFDLIKTDGTENPKEPRGVVSTKKLLFKKLGNAENPKMLGRLLDALEAEDGYIATDKVDAIAKAALKE